ncbi:MAG: hypothetical protein O8C56_09790, partial [Candidatus Methanoperedens sp.]|nr:hypothetical protein [Candidatus Methanoperedens sp.]
MAHVSGPLPWQRDFIEHGAIEPCAILLAPEHWAGNVACALPLIVGIAPQLAPLVATILQEL